jgi:hypothetical protein
MFARPNWKSGNILKAQSCPIFHGNHESFGRFTFTPSDLRAKWLHNEIKYLACFRAPNESQKIFWKHSLVPFFMGITESPDAQFSFPVICVRNWQNWWKTRYKIVCMFPRPKWKSKNVLKAQFCPIFHGNHGITGRTIFVSSDLRAKLAKTYLIRRCLLQALFISRTRNSHKARSIENFKQSM